MSETEIQEEGPRRRYKAPWAQGGPEYDPLLPYGPKVYLARKKKSDPWWFIALEVKLSVFKHTHSMRQHGFLVSMFDQKLKKKV